MFLTWVQYNIPMMKQSRKYHEHFLVLMGSEEHGVEKRIRDIHMILVDTPPADSNPNKQHVGSLGHRRALRLMFLLDSTQFFLDFMSEAAYGPNGKFYLQQNCQYLPGCEEANPGPHGSFIRNLKVCSVLDLLFIHLFGYSF